MSIIELVHQHPFATLFFVSLILLFLDGVFKRFVRGINIFWHGYPLVHCDADGELPQTETIEEIEKE